MDLSRDLAQSQKERIVQQKEAIRWIRTYQAAPRTYCIITYGCQMNERDSETISGMLTEMGMKPAEKESADLILINTCCIRNRAERKALGNMDWLRQLKTANPGLLLCVCGCMVQQPEMSQKIYIQYPFFDVVFGTHNLYRFPVLLAEALESKRQIVEVLPDDSTIIEGMPTSRTKRYSAYLTIASGCNNFCSYCIVPYVRGRERSRSEDDIMREAEKLLEDGVKEITLLGQNVNSYGSDRGEKNSFPKLLKKLDRLGVPRIRFMTSHPKDLSDDLIDCYVNCSHLAKHLHLPVQSGSDRILREMNRSYTRDHYLSRVNALRNAVPGLALTTDIIVGFPGETDEDFQETLSLVHAVRYDSAFMFIYSPRQGTVAAKMPDKIPDVVSKERIEILIQEQEAITAQILQDLVDSEQRVLIEQISRRDTQQLAGKSSRGITCNFIGEPDWIGKFACVRIREAGHNTLKADFSGFVSEEAPEWL